MGGAHSREDLDTSESEEESEDEQSQEEEDEGTYQDVEEEEEEEEEEKQRSSERRRPETPSSLDDIESKLKILKLKYPSHNPNLTNAVKLYLHVGGYTPKSKWIVSDKLTPYSFIRTSQIDEDEEESEESWWVLKVRSKVRAKVQGRREVQRN